MPNSLSFYALLQVKLLTKLRNELRISHVEHKEVLVKVSSNEHIKSLRKFSLANSSVFKKMDPAFDAHVVVRDKVGSNGQRQLSTSSTSCFSLAQQSPISERSMSSARGIGISDNSSRAKEGPCFEPHAVVSAKRLKSVNGRALAYLKCSPSAKQLPVAVPAVMEKGCTDDTLDSETLSCEGKAGCTLSSIIEEKHNQSNAGHVPSCVDHHRQESGKRKTEVPVMWGSKSLCDRKKKDTDLEHGSEIIKICLTASLLNKIEKLFRENPDPANLETAKSILKVQEKDLLDALVKLSEVSCDACLSTNGQPANPNKHDEEMPSKPSS